MRKLTLQPNEPLSCLVQINHHWTRTSHLSHTSCHICASSWKTCGMLSLFHHCPLCSALLKIEMVLAGWHAGSVVDLLASKGRLLAGSGIDKMLPSTHTMLSSLLQTIHFWLCEQDDRGGHCPVFPWSDITSRQLGRILDWTQPAKKNQAWGLQEWLSQQSKRAAVLQGGAMGGQCWWVMVHDPLVLWRWQSDKSEYVEGNH